MYKAFLVTECMRLHYYTIQHSGYFTLLYIELLLQPKLLVTQLSSAFNCETDQSSLGKLSLGSLVGSFKLGSAFKRPGFTFFN